MVTRINRLGWAAFAVVVCVSFVSVTSADDFGISFVTISGDTGSSGFPNYDFRISVYEISNAQYISLGSSTGEPAEAYDQTTPYVGGVWPEGTPHAGQPKLNQNEPLHPVTYVSWLEAAQFVNKLNTITGHHVAYNFVAGVFNTWSEDEAASNGTNLYRHKDAFYFLPSGVEWAKAARWNSTTQTLQTYSTKDGQPLNQFGWNYYDRGTQTYSYDPPGPSWCAAWYVNNGYEELNGTYNMMGNVNEWIESCQNETWDYRQAIGGCFWQEYGMSQGVGGSGGWIYERWDVGFRVASKVPIQDYVWTKTGVGNWNNSDNWECGSVPSSPGLVLFDGAGTCQVQYPEGIVESMAIRNDAVTFTGYPTVLIIDGDEDSNRSLTVDDDGHAIFNGPELVICSESVVGDAGDGMLEIKNCEWQLMDALMVGRQGTGDGIVSIEHADVDASDAPVTVGDAGQGEIHVFDETSISVESLILGNQEGSYGKVDINGSSSLTTVYDGAYGSITVGLNGSGFLSVSGESLVESADLVVGDSGIAEMLIDDGGVVNTNIGGGMYTTVIGQFAGSTGSLEVKNTSETGESGMQLENLVVGNGGEGHLKVEGKGSFVTIVGDLTLGKHGSGIGHVYIDGKGAVSVNDVVQLHCRDLVVGDQGRGSLKIVNGAKVTCSSVRVDSKYSGPNGNAYGNIWVHGNDSGLYVSDMDIGGSDAIGKNDVSVWPGGKLQVETLNVWNEAELFLGVGAACFAELAHIHSGGTITICNTTHVGDIILSGFLCAGCSPGTATIEGDVTMSETAVLEIEIGGYIAGEEYDVLYITGNAELGGTVQIKFINGFAPQQGDSFEFIDVTGGNLDLTGITIEVYNIENGFQYETNVSDGKLSMTAMNDGVYQSPQADADQLHIAGPIPNQVHIGTSGTVTAKVQKNFVGVSGVDVLFTKKAGNLTLTSGSISPDGTQSLITTGYDGQADLTFDADAESSALIEVAVVNTPLKVYSVLHIITCPYAADLDEDCDVDFVDFAIFALAWLTEPGDAQWNPDCDISNTNDNIIDIKDLGVFCDNWLLGK